MKEEANTTGEIVKTKVEGLPVSDRMSVSNQKVKIRPCLLLEAIGYLSQKRVDKLRGP